MNTARIVALESLSPDDRLTLENYRRELAAAGVCINVLRGSEPWDIRPLILEGGQVYLYRPLSPDGSEAPQLVRRLSGVVDAVLDVKPAASMLWIRRRFHPELLSTTLPRMAHDRSSLWIARGILAELARYYERGVPHGGISLTNIAVGSNSVSLLDPVVGWYTRSRKPLNPADDLPGVAAVLEQLLRDGLFPGEIELFSRCRSADAAGRPAFAEVRDLFGRDERQSVVTNPGDGRTGRVIPQPAFQAPTAPTLPVVPSPAVESVSRVEPVLPKRENRLTLIVTGAVIVAILVLAVLKVSPDLRYRTVRSLPLFGDWEDADARALWASGEKSKMREVARQAVLAHDIGYENVIISGVTRGIGTDAVAKNVISIVFGSDWSDELSSSDVRAAVLLAVSPLVPEAAGMLAPLATTHPAVLLAALASAPVSGEQRVVLNAPIALLTELPAPIGPAFGQLSQLGVADGSAPEARALAHILTGDFSLPVVEALFTGTPSMELLLGKIQLLQPIMDAYPAFGDSVFTVVRDSESPLGQIVSWFQIDEVATWSNLQGGDKLKIILGKLPDRNLSIAQYSDLLTFPLPSVKSAAKSKLIQVQGDSTVAPTYDLLASPENQLARDQTVGLVSALLLKNEARQTFIGTWFDTKPDRKTVLKLLAARVGIRENDPFSLEAARYLKNGNWDVDRAVMSQLFTHPDPFVRSLIYSKLDVTKPDDKRLLEDQVQRENDPKLKSGLLERLGTMQ